LGTPKQLIQFEGQSLLQHNIKKAVDSIVNQVVVVLGANAEAILLEAKATQQQIDQPNIHITINNEWSEGMASSIRCGLSTLLETTPSTEAVILLVCDQPYITSALLNDIIKAHQETNKPIITCTYENTFGPPTLFHKSMFPELLQLKGDTGARKIIQQFTNEVATIPFPLGRIDIDTPSDFDNLITPPSNLHP
jgi:molybdenum cofactor cytidylyltransferase